MAERIYFPGFTTLQREMNRLFDEFLQSTEATTEAQATWTPRADLSETAEAYLIRMDLPGVARESLDLQFNEGVLTVTGQRTATYEAENETPRHVERPHGRFFRSFTLPQTIDPAGIKAELREGVLTIRIPKLAAHQPRKIAVE